MRCTAGERIADCWWIFRIKTHPSESFKLLALRDGADLPKCEFLSLTKFEGGSEINLCVNQDDGRKQKCQTILTTFRTFKRV